MAALWGNLLTELKHTEVKHRAASPHLLRGVEQLSSVEEKGKKMKMFKVCSQNTVNIQFTPQGQTPAWFTPGFFGAFCKKQSLFFVFFGGGCPFCLDR